MPEEDRGFGADADTPGLTIVIALVGTYLESARGRIAVFCTMVLIGTAIFVNTGYKLRAEQLPPDGSNPRVRIDPRSPPTRIQPANTTFRTDTSLVLVNVTVADSRNRPATGLSKDIFRVFEDKIEQNVKFFSSDDEALSVGVVFDTSGSMASRIGHSRQSVRSFLDTANPQDEFFLVQFNDRAELVMPFTSAIEEIQNQITFAKAKGSTALFDAIYLALNQMKKARNSRKALLLVSDGEENWSRYSEREVYALIREADVQIYSIGLRQPDFSRSRRGSKHHDGSTILTALAEETGGRYFPLSKMSDLPDISQKIGFELRNQYTLGYISTNREGDGKYRRLEVKLIQPRGSPRLKAYYRRGYYASAN